VRNEIRTSEAEAAHASTPAVRRLTTLRDMRIEQIWERIAGLTPTR
jgi:hypothetical protein